jgi:recombinational DNA repair protein (RecF pathway)
MSIQNAESKSAAPVALDTQPPAASASTSKQVFKEQLSAAERVTRHYLDRHSEDRAAKPGAA